MTEIKFTIPGALPYSNVIVTATPEELGLRDLDAYSLGVANTVFLNLFNQGVQEGKGIDVSPPKGETDTRVLEAIIQTEAYEKLIQERIDATAVKNLAEQSMEETRAILEAGLGSTTEVPWNKKVKAKKPAWEETTSAAATNDDDDF